MKRFEDKVYIKHKTLETVQQVIQKRGKKYPKGTVNNIVKKTLVWA